MIQSTDESGLKMWTCSCCGYVSKKTTNMYKHIERKHLFLALKCDFCQKEFSNRNDFNIHNKNFHNWSYCQETISFHQKWWSSEKISVLSGSAQNVVIHPRTKVMSTNMSSRGMLDPMDTTVTSAIRAVLLEMLFVSIKLDITAIKIKYCSIFS